MADLLITPASSLMEFKSGSSNVTTANLVLNTAGNLVYSASQHYFSGSSTFLSNIPNSTILQAQGTNGTIFSVVDDLSDSLFAVNDAAGLPVLEAFADDRVILGQYNQYDFIVKNNRVGIGTSIPSYKFDVYGDGRVTGSLVVATQTNSNLLVGDTVVPGTSWYGTGVFGKNATNKVLVGYLGSLTSGAVIGANNNTFTNWTDLNINGSNLIFRSSGETENMRLTSGGYLGIGTTNPSVKLHVYSGSSGATAYGFSHFVLESNSNTYINILSPNAGESAILFGNVSSNVAGSVVYNNSTTPNGLQFRVNGNSIKMVIDSGGNVGLGTNSPSASLQIGSHFNAMPSATALSFLGGKTLRILNSDGNSDYGAYISSAGTSYITIGTRYAAADTDVLTVNRSKVGVGTTNPAGILHVIGRNIQESPGVNNVLSVSDSDFPTKYTILGYTSSWDAGVITALYSGVAWRPLLINPIGNAVGIGTFTTSSFLLTIGGHTGPSADNTYNLGSSTIRWANLYATNITASTVSASFVGNISFSGKTDTYIPKWLNNQLSATSSITDTNTQVNIIPSLGGYVGIGLTNPIGSLHVSSSTAASVFVVDTPGGASVGKYVLTVGGGQVGIGTLPPGGAIKFVVRGTAISPASSGTVPSGSVMFTTSNGNNLYMGAYLATPYGFWFQNSDVTNLATHYPICLNPLGGGVGIGIGEGVGVDALFHVRGLTEQMRLAYDFTNTAKFTVDSSGYLSIVSSGGRVGVGTTTPQSTLHVWGTISSSAVTTKTLNGVNVTYPINIPDVGGTPQWVKLGTLGIGQGGYSAVIRIVSNAGYNANRNQNFEAYIRFKTSNSGTVDAYGFGADSSYYITGYNNLFSGSNSVKWKGNASGVSATAYDLYVCFNYYLGLGSYYTVETTGGTWTNSGAGGQIDPGTGSATVCISSNEFYINNTLFVNGSGSKVGILNWSPRNTLDVSSNGTTNTNAGDPTGVAGAFVSPTQTGQGSTLSIESNDAVAADKGGILSFGGRYQGGTDVASWASIKGLKHNSTSGEYGGYLSFYTRTTGFGSTERLRITTTGYVGIGTTNPRGFLTVATGSGGNDAPSTVAANTCYLGLGGSEYGASSYRLIGMGYIVAAMSYFPAYMGYQEMTTAGYTYGDLIFGTRNVVTDTAPTERLRITNGGNVGINTTIPNDILHVRSTATSGSIYMTDLSFNNRNNGQTIHSALSIQSASYIGMPRLKLARYTGGGTNVLSWIGHCGSDGGKYNLNFAVASVPTVGSGFVDDAPDSSVRLSIDSGTGYVGIGTTNPSVQFHVIGSSILATGTAINPDSYSNSTVAGLIGDGGGWAVYGIGGNNGVGKSWGMGTSGTTLYIGVSNGVSTSTIASHMRCDGVGRYTSFPAGNVGVGTTTPAALLHVWGTISGSAITGSGLYINGNLVVNGTITELSAKRFKTDIRPIYDILPKLDSITPVIYKKIGNDFDEYGVIAEEVNVLFPELVKKTSDGEMESVNYSRITSILLQAVKELKKEIDILKSKL